MCQANLSFGPQTAAPQKEQQMTQKEGESDFRLKSRPKGGSNVLQEVAQRQTGLHACVLRGIE